MERGDRLARGRQSLLVRVRIGVLDLAGDRALQVFRRAESEGARVADIQLDQHAALVFQFARTSRQFSADLVAHLGQAFAGFQAFDGHRAGGADGGAGQPSGFRPRAACAPGDDPPRGRRRADAPLEWPDDTVTHPLIPLRSIGWSQRDAADPQWLAMLAEHPEARAARVVEQHRSGYIVAEGPGEGYATQSPPEWQRAPSYKKGALSTEQRAAVGDWVLVEGTGKQSQIVAMLPRHSAIKRAAAGEHYKQQVIAANIDTVFVVCGLDGDFNPRRIERYLLLVQGSGCTPVVVLTKADTVDDLPAARAALVGSVGDRSRWSRSTRATRRACARWIPGSKPDAQRCWSARPARASRRLPTRCSASTG